ncbi:hypothetical protein AB0K18_43730 [Nonomuraea sp. NPDC049421]
MDHPPEGFGIASAGTMRVCWSRMPTPDERLAMDDRSLELPGQSDNGQ